jgi:AcrR family transcriptional regulator
MPPTATPSTDEAAPASESAPRGRPRSSTADQAIRQATVDLLHKAGYTELTMTGVAALAGVSTATLYRRWRSKAELVISTLQAMTPTEAMPDTGSLREDCRALLGRLVGRLVHGADEMLFPGLLSEVTRDPELAELFRSSLLVPRRAWVATMLERAERRGELRPGLDYDVVMDVLFGPIYSRVLVNGFDTSAGFVDQVVDLFVRAVRADRPA